MHKSSLYYSTGLFTLYDENYAVSCSNAGIFDAGVDATVIFQDLVDD